MKSFYALISKHLICENLCVFMMVIANVLPYSKQAPKISRGHQVPFEGQGEIQPISCCVAVMVLSFYRK